MPWFENVPTDGSLNTAIRLLTVRVLKTLYFASLLTSFAGLAVFRVVELLVK
jgi:hypothetical protein